MRRRERNFNAPPTAAENRAVDRAMKAAMRRSRLARVREESHRKEARAVARMGYLVLALARDGGCTFCNRGGRAWGDHEAKGDHGGGCLIGEYLALKRANRAALRKAGR